MHDEIMMQRYCGTNPFEYNTPFLPGAAQLYSEYDA